MSSFMLTKSLPKESGQELPDFCTLRITGKGGGREVTSNLRTYCCFSSVQENGHPGHYLYSRFNVVWHTLGLN